MCGICGIFSPKNEVDFIPAIDRMTQAIDHRGPDGKSTWINQTHGVALGHVRLAIIDLEGGIQPMVDSTGTCHIVFNGEIYNYREIRKQLVDMGAPLQTDSDTEAILCGYMRWGKGVLSRLNGMYAFAIYDERNHSLFLARDRTGIKPLYYFSNGDQFVFASEIKSILSDNTIPRALNYPALADYLTLGYVVGPKTMFANISEIPPGTSITVSNGGSHEIVQHWRWERKPLNLTLPQANELTKRVLLKSLENHLVADVPVGAFLSGGIDSSTIALLIGKELGQTIDTFHVSFGEAAYDESRFAQLVATAAGSRHHTIQLENSTASMDDMRQIALQFDQPFSDSSAIPSYYICREIRNYVKTALAGDGGDEMFGGYHRFRYAVVAEQLARLSRPVVGMLLAVNKIVGLISPDIARKFFRLLTAAHSLPDDRLLVLSCFTYPGKLDELIAESGIDKIGAYKPGFGARDEQTNDSDAFIDATVRCTLPDHYLKKVDMMSSAHGLEVRVPFLGNDVLDLSACLPTALKFNERTSKTLLKNILLDYMPSEFINRKKQGFDIPLDTYLGLENKNIMAAEIKDEGSLLGTLIKRAVRNELCDEFEAGSYSLSKYSRQMVYNHVYMFWCLKLWLDKWQPTL